MNRPNRKSLILGDLQVKVDGKKILHGVSFTVRPGEVHVVMGPNGSGKSTLAAAILGYPSYEVGKSSRIILDGTDIRKLPTDVRVKMGLFLAFQNPVAVPGVNIINLLRNSYQEIYAFPKRQSVTSLQNPVLTGRWRATDISLSKFMKSVDGYARYLRINPQLYLRGINDGFSGGEKKKTEMLTALVIKPKYAVFDEIDTGLDVDALKSVAGGIKILRDQGSGIIVITHYQRILKFFKPDAVHIMVSGKIVESGTGRLVRKIESDGYRKYFS